MPTTYYTTLNGRIRGQSASGVRTDYLTDALGSVTATVDESAQVVNTYRYKPYGERLAKTGSGEDPRFLWAGDTGSRATGRAYAEQYNQARHYGSKQGQWTSVDPLWPEEGAYVYSAANPSTYRDPSGLACGTGDCCCCASDIIVSSIRAIHGSSVTPPTPWDQKYGFAPNFYGHSFYVTPVWEPITSGDPQPRMDRCRWRWEEMGTMKVRGNFPSDDRYGEGPKRNNLQHDMATSCDWDSCKRNQCRIWDAPGIADRGPAAFRRCAKSLGKDVPFDICIRWTLTSTCPSGECYFDSIYVEALFMVTVKPSGQILLFHQIYPPSRTPTQRCRVRKKHKECP